jgi:hypothetical protein
MRNSLGKKMEKRKSAATCQRTISHGAQIEGIDAMMGIGHDEGSLDRAKSEYREVSNIQ